jgi:hypothetical protein
MSNRPTDPNRRRVLRSLAGGVALIPVSGLIAHGTAMASSLPQLSETDPVAQSLNYRHDATQAPRVDKAGTPAGEQVCKNCQLAQGEGEWLGCSIFPGKAVNAQGWCAGWVKRVG